MRRWCKTIALAGLAALALFCYTGYSAAETSPEFSADMVSRSGNQTMSGKIYAAQDKMRTEMPEAIIITRLDQNVSWVIMPQEQMYMEQPIDRNTLPKTSKEVAGELERVSLGKEDVDGQPAEKFKVTYTQAGARVVMYQWLLDSGFPVKMEDEDGSWGVEYKNVSLGPQPDSLFEPPAGFQKMFMPSASGSGMPSMEDMMKKMGGN